MTASSAYTKHLRNGEYFTVSDVRHWEQKPLNVFSIYLQLFVTSLSLCHLVLIDVGIQPPPPQTHTHRQYCPSAND